MSPAALVHHARLTALPHPAPLLSLRAGWGGWAPASPSTLALQPSQAASGMHAGAVRQRQVPAKPAQLPLLPSALTACQTSLSHRPASL